MTPRISAWTLRLLSRVLLWLLSLILFLSLILYLSLILLLIPLLPTDRRGTTKDGS